MTQPLPSRDRGRSLGLAVDRTRKQKRQAETGSTMVEFSIVILPLLALVFLIMDSAWVLFGRACLQHAAREGVRYAVTATPLSGSCMNASIRQVAQQNSFGFVPAAAAASDITVTYFDPTTLKPVTGANSTAAGNVVQVSISKVSVTSIGLWHDPTPLNLGAQAADVMESNPSGPPCP